MIPTRIEKRTSPGIAPCPSCGGERCGLRLRRQPGRVDLGVLVVLASVLALAVTLILQALPRN